MRLKALTLMGNPRLLRNSINVIGALLMFAASGCESRTTLTVGPVDAAVLPAGINDVDSGWSKVADVLLQLRSP